MRPNRILRYLLVGLFVTLSLVTREVGGVARAERVGATSDQPRLVAISHVGTINRRQIFHVLVNRGTGEALAFGYFNYIHGLDEKDLYLDDNGPHESKALFTLYIAGRVTRLHTIGSVLAYEVLGRSTVYFDPTPDGDFANPDTFRNGTPIATGEENVVFTFDSDSGAGNGDVRLRQTQAWPFEFKGERIQFGEVGDHAVIWRGKELWWTNWLDWARVFCTATTIQGEREVNNAGKPTH